MVWVMCIKTQQNMDHMYKSWDVLYDASTLKRKCHHFYEILITGCTESCHLTTSKAASDENCINMTIFLFQCPAQTNNMALFSSN